MSAMVASARVMPYLMEAEGLRLAADNRDGTWTCGYGHTQGVTKGTRCSAQVALAWLLDDIELRERCVKAVVTVPLTQGEFDALVSWTFNCGAGLLVRSTGLRSLNHGHYAAAWDDSFAKYVTSKGVVMPGLVKRRANEGKWWHEASQVYHQ